MSLKRHAATRANKYGAKRTTVDGISFASQKEARRFSELKLLERAGEVQQLQLQRSFPLHVGGEHIATYRADFCYRTPDGAFVVEDVKGFRTPVYRLKKKLMKGLFQIDVQEV